MIPRVIPCLLLRGSGLVKTRRFAEPKYVGDPINAVRIFNEKEVDELMFLDIAATAERRPPNIDVVRDIAGECFMPLTYGGGVGEMVQIEQLFHAGCEKILLNAAAHRQPELVVQAAKAFGSQSIVAGIDVRCGRWRWPSVYTESGQRNCQIDPVADARRVEALGAGEILLNSIDRDGMRSGYDLDLIRAVANAVSIPVVACGGASELADLRAAVDAGASAVAAGSMFVFHGKHRAVLITYPTAAELARLFAEAPATFLQ